MAAVQGIKFQGDCHGNQSIVHGNASVCGSDGFYDDSIRMRGWDVGLDNTSSK